MPEVAHLAPFRAVVVVDAIVTAAWRAVVSTGLVQSGGLYLIAWGRDSSHWDDAVDMANLEHFKFGDIPDDRFVVTTWHDNEDLTRTIHHRQGAEVGKCRLSATSRREIKVVLRHVFPS